MTGDTFAPKVVRDEGTPSLGDVYQQQYRPGDWGAPRTIPEHDPSCPNCGEPFDSDEWHERHLSSGPALGESWHYTCPRCNNETLECGI
ncbi:hypothetical protein [Halomarina oriensis]|uniref:Uncharacterized protein n=1 Tax=Halomarina oriensis TaxID=671145 RepID=A0A6B0GXK6_9EURY|nr:hypothetical protein [Halomarina oriensis]MWG36508.1 hypothetical protein [Halomarina oriensis]